MMKRFFNIIFVGLASFSFGGCTLMMDDLEKEEENVDLETVGFDKPYTEKTEFGDVTFQYGDSTQVLRKKALDYLVEVDHDTILYFSDNIPKDLLVPVGKYVSMGCNEKLRHGLCSKVISLTKENGMFRMETTRMPQSKVYKLLEMDLSLSYDQQMAFDPENYLDEQDLTTIEDDTVNVFTDWAFFGPEVVARKEAEIRQRAMAKRALTRADKEDEEDDDHTTEEGNKDYNPEDYINPNPVKTEEKDIRLFTCNTQKLEKKGGLFKKLFDKGVKASIVCSYHEKATIRHIQKLSKNQDFVREEQDEYPSHKLKVSVGWGKKGDLNNAKKLEAAWQKMYDEFNIIERYKKTDISAGIFMIHIPIGGTIPIEFFVRVKPVAQLSFDIVGELEIQKGLGHIHKVVEYNNGKCTYCNETKSRSKESVEKYESFSIKKLDICGHIALTAGAEVLFGFATTGGQFGLGMGVQVNMNLTFEMGAYMSFDRDRKGSQSETNADLIADLSITPQIKAFAQSPGGKEWGSINFLEFLSDKSSIPLLGPTTYPFYPTLCSSHGGFKVSQAGSDPGADVYASFEIGDMNIMAFHPQSVMKTFYIGAKYFRKTKAGNLVSVGQSELEPLKDQMYEYSFFDTDYRTGDEYVVVPFIEQKGKMERKFDYSSHPIICKEGTWSFGFTYMDLFQQHANIQDNYESYTFIPRVYINNLSWLNEVDEWGVEIIMYYKNKGQNNWKIFPAYNQKRYPVKESIKKPQVALELTVKIDDTGYDLMVDCGFYYITKDDKGNRTLWYVDAGTDDDDEFKHYRSLPLTTNVEDWHGEIDKNDQKIDMGQLK